MQKKSLMTLYHYTFSADFTQIHNKEEMQENNSDKELAVNLQLAIIVYLFCQMDTSRMCIFLPCRSSCIDDLWKRPCMKLSQLCRHI